MSGQPNNMIGAIACPLCREDLPVRENGRGTLNISCPWCGSSAYVKPGTKGHGIVKGWMNQENPEPAAAEKKGYF